MADAIGVKQEQYRRYEVGENEIKASYIIKFAKFYDVSADYILGLTKDERKFW
ncbi:MAG: helix-turn-helix transcriptional regulator [Acutalibacteraceae bacterium]|nr:helix-turn-helix transcriptional regulator [Acutalibacteraceae bacterium]